MLDITDAKAVAARTETTMLVFKEAGYEISEHQAETMATRLWLLDDTEFVQCVESFIETH